MSISFGTDGWRAVLDKDFTRGNVERVTLAIAKYVADNFGFTKPLLVGYDPRRMADELSGYCAEILTKKGFDVYYSERVVPTPVLAYNAKIKDACAIMFTASHNPPEYLGMKFIPDYAGPATSEITDEIVGNLDKPFETSGRQGSFIRTDFAPEYYEHLKELIDYEAIKKIKTNIIFDGLYSASIGYFDEILKSNNIPYESLHMFRDTNFGGGMPDPKPKYLNDLIEAVKAKPNSIGLANDGDADRFGVINEDGEYVSPNEIIAILLKHLIQKGLKGAVVKTVGSSLLIDVVTKKLGVDQGTASFVAGFGTTAGMQGCAGVFPALLIIYVCNITGTPIDITMIVMTIFVVTIGSLGIAGIPGTATMAASVGLSGVGMGAQFSNVSPILAIDPIIDMARTMLNVTGSLTNALVVDKMMGSLDMKAYNDMNAGQVEKKN